MTTLRFDLYLKLFAIALLMQSHWLVGQTVQKEKVIAAYVYSFARNIEWPKEANEFTIQLITDNPILLEEFNELSQSKEVRGNPIKLVSSSSAIISQQTHLVYISNNYNSAVRSIFLQARGHNVLLVTDNFLEDRFTMINFKEAEDNTLAFEINRANIINQGLKILPEMILLGGTDIDMADLYREAQDSIQSLESKIGNLQGRYDSLYSSSERIQNYIEQQQDLIDHQLEEISLKQSTIINQSKALDSLSVGVEASEQRLNSLLTQMREREEDFEKLQSSISDQETQLEEGSLILEEQFRLIEEQDNLISQRESSLEQMVSVVSTQKKTVGMLVFFSLVTLASLLAIVRAYRQRRDHARKLAEQRDELSQTLKELHQTQSKLVQSEKMASLGVLTAGIAHEINNAINFVASGIHVLESNIKEITPVITQVKRLKRDENLSDNIEKLIDVKEKLGYNNIQKVIAEVVKNIKIGSDRTTEIVKGLRTFSMTNTEAVQDIDIVNEIDVALLLLNNRIKDKIKVEKKYDHKTLLVDGYKGQLGQVFLNILSNAVDALQTVEHPEIVVDLTVLKTKIKIAFTDNGVGMDKEDLARIFDPFYTTKKIGAGTGLGLSIAYGIVEQHKGNVEVTSRKGKGTSFTITLPFKIEN